MQIDKSDSNSLAKIGHQKGHHEDQECRRNQRSLPKVPDVVEMR